MLQKHSSKHDCALRMNLLAEYDTIAHGLKAYALGGKWSIMLVKAGGMDSLYSPDTIT